MISIFKRRTTCGYIRGVQIAKHIGARLNPEDEWHNDTCIYVKQTPKGGKRQFFDIIDEHKYLPWLKQHPEIGIIAISRCAEEYLKNEMSNTIVFIPQQHCNFGNIQRTRTTVTTAGWCGARGCFEPFESEIREKLGKIGLELKTYYEDQYKTRQDIVNFYLGIDIQVVWRMQAEWNKMLKNPLKVSNASSFSIPTISKPEPCTVLEYDGCFLPATTIDELVECARQLKDNSMLYQDIADKALQRSKYYHINNVANLYKELDI